MKELVRLTFMPELMKAMQFINHCLCSSPVFTSIDSILTCWNTPCQNVKLDVSFNQRTKALVSALCWVDLLPGQWWFWLLATVSHLWSFGLGFRSLAICEIAAIKIILGDYSWFVLQSGPVMDWWPVQGVTCLCLPVMAGIGYSTSVGLGEKQFRWWMDVVQLK